MKYLIIFLLFYNTQIYSNDTFDSHSVSGKFWFYSKDQENLVYPQFRFKDDFFYEISFWFDLYATYRSSTIIFHDASDLRIIYDIFTADSLYSKDLNRFTKDALSQEMVKMRHAQIKDEFTQLSRGKNDGAMAKQILHVLNTYKVKIPTDKVKLKKFFLNLSDNMRYQIGQRGAVIDGLNKLFKYLSTIEHYLKVFGLPQDLKTLSILESSFNTQAISKVGASGVWQIMDSVGKIFLTIDSNEDQRKNPIISALAAFRILKENYKALGSWDFTILSYNSGISHIISFKRKSKLNLRNYLTTYSHDSFGFASKNYIFEFYSLNYALAYKKYLYPEVLNLNTPFDKEYSIYVSLCNMDLKKDKVLSSLLDDNTQFLNSKIRRGSALISKTTLPKKSFLKLTDQQINSVFPRNFSELIKGHNCSTR